MNTVKMCQHLELSYKNSLRIVILALTLLQSLSAVRGAQSAGSLKVVYAVNAGGREHTDSSGIHYDADPLHNKIGTASDYGNNLLIIGRVPEQDEILYRTERYHTATFGYDIPIDGDGEYALIMKFCEVYFNEPNKKVFDVQLNKQHTIVSQLDIYKQVGHGTAHEESIQFAVINGKLYFKDEQSEVRNGMVRLDFIKGTRDNPKINAFALLKGDTKHIPKLPPLAQRQQEHPDADLFEERKPQQQPAQNDIFDDDEDEDDVEEEFDDTANAEDVEDAIDNEVVRQGRSVNERVEKPIDPDEAIFHERKVSGPRHPNPYIIDDSAVLLPLFVAIAAFIPMLYCLCKL